MPLSSASRDTRFPVSRPGADIVRGTSILRYFGQLARPCSATIRHATFFRRANGNKIRAETRSSPLTFGVDSRMRFLIDFNLREIYASNPAFA